jgi:S1-C subfamily serine protease
MRHLLLLFLTFATAGRAAVTDEPVDDQRLQGSLLKFAEAQFDAGKTVKVDALKAQLGRRRCQVVLPPVAQKSDPLAAAAARVRPGVAVVASMFKCKRCSHWHLNTASGFFISSDGIFVTNHHVVAGGEKETLVVLSGDGRMAPVREVLAADPVADVAILRCDGSGFTPLPLSADAADGSTVGVWSHPSSRFFCLSAGIVARRFMLRKSGGPVEALAITADYARGSSGGPVFDDRGNVVGMVASTDSVYYDQENGQQKNLQMVFKNCVSARSILALIGPKPASELKAAATEPKADNAKPAAPK